MTNTATCVLFWFSRFPTAAGFDIRISSSTRPTVFSVNGILGQPCSVRSRVVSCSDFDAEEVICSEAESEWPSLVSDTFRSGMDFIRLAWASWRTWSKSVLVLGGGGWMESELAGWLAWLVLDRFILLVCTLRLPSGVCLSVDCWGHTQNDDRWGFV